ncbi:hypothetical protein BHM03_00003097 [Ensete ventricosum]|nr:hypothetical protein BHM03_00003097 [Ensete ventricosum]
MTAHCDRNRATWAAAIPSIKKMPYSATKGVCVRSMTYLYVQKRPTAMEWLPVEDLRRREGVGRWGAERRSSANGRAQAVRCEGCNGSEPQSGRSRSWTRKRLHAVASPVPTATKPTATVCSQRVFTFGKGMSDGDKSMKSLVSARRSLALGGKGANLAEMASIGLSVPPGFTVSTEACQEYQEGGRKLPAGLWEEILEGLSAVEEVMGARLGDPSKPLLLSVRSGAAVSMPGMMDTVLNLGLNDEVVAGLALKSGERFAYDSYRRFLDMFGNVVCAYSSDRSPLISVGH